MGHRTKDEQEMYRALSMVRQLAAKRVNEAVREQASEKDLHKDYWQREIDEAQAVGNWCFVQQMRIDSD